MDQAKQIDVDAYVDSQRISGFNWSLVFWSFVITLVDGYDIVAAPAAGPFFLREWGLKSPAELTAAFSAANFGVLFGAPLFGWIGDRYGRKIAIVLSLLVFGLLTLVVTQAHSVEQLTWARFITGFGIGGVMANTISLNAEMAPRHMRATFIILMFIGNTLGGFFPPMVANFLVPSHGWQIIFWIGGLVPIAIAVICWFTVPESLKFLSLDPRRSDDARRVARKMSSPIAIGPMDRIVTGEHGAVKARFADLFAGSYAVVTPLLWLLFAINLMVFYFIAAWMQTIIGPAIAKAGGSPATAQTANAMFQLGGSVCGLVMCRFIDRMGLRPVILLIVLAIPATAGIGYYATSPELIWVAAAAGFCILGIQFGLNATAGMIYPTPVRSYGVGWAFGIGRFGAFGGPAIGGLLISMNVPLGQLYLYAALPLVVSLIACIIMIRLHDTSREGNTGAAVLSH
jgi:AAHS family 4-hydroxybenzoate transporter-like MFS transporter